ncbi:MAG TPA: hypothetical protein VGY32_08745, partial [Solirubrobacteraceae bacterium]|nr:hypothetical protein [Solirubrobacteraceae bacterium]
GGVKLLDPLQRLSLLPSPRQPLLVELGVLQGGHRVLFAVAPGTVLRGPGVCVPGPLDCEILSLAQDQIEAVSTDATSAPVAMFALTDIVAVNHPSSAAAQQARQSVSWSGSQFLAQLPLPALQLFPYDAGVGAVVDTRNLTVGG